MPIVKKVAPAPSSAAASSENSMEDKFKRTMDWGTPRLVTRNVHNRNLDIMSAKAESRNLLMKFANARKGKVEEVSTEPKQ